MALSVQDKSTLSTRLRIEIISNFVVGITSNSDSKCERASVRPTYLNKSRATHSPTQTSMLLRNYDTFARDPNPQIAPSVKVASPNKSLIPMAAPHNFPYRDGCLPPLSIMNLIIQATNC
jgi:hypothetical protein